MNVKLQKTTSAAHETKDWNERRREAGETERDCAELFTMDRMCIKTSAQIGIYNYKVPVYNFRIKLQSHLILELQRNN